MTFCTQCGKETPEGKFCQHCGKPMGTVPPGEITPPPPGPTPPPASPFTSQPAAAQPPFPAIPVVPHGIKPAGLSNLVFGIIGTVAMLLVAIGSALPWDRVSVIFASRTFGGLNGDGTITIVIAFLALAFFIVGLIGRYRWPFIVSLVGCVLIVAVTLYDTINIATTNGHSVGYGLIVCLIFGIAGVVAGIGGVSAKRH